MEKLERTFSCLLSFLDKKEQLIQTQHTYANQDLTDVAQILKAPRYLSSMHALDKCLSEIQTNTADSSKY